MSDLAKKKCIPCEGGVEALFCEKAEELQAELNPEWMLIDQCRMLARTFVLPDFKSALELANKIGAIAEEEGHHPNLALTWGRADVEIYTHSVNGLTESDFVLAAKIGRLAGAA